MPPEHGGTSRPPARMRRRTGEGRSPSIGQDDCRDLGATTERVLTEIGARGSLGELSRFRDAVYMSPRMNLAQPTVANTALETQFVVGMAADMGADAFAKTFRIERRMIERARQFEDAIR